MTNKFQIIGMFGGLVEILIDCYCVCLQVFENRNKFAYLEDEDEVGSEGQDD